MNEFAIAHGLVISISCPRISPLIITKSNFGVPILCKFFHYFNKYSQVAAICNGISSKWMIAGTAGVAIRDVSQL